MISPLPAGGECTVAPAGQVHNEPGPCRRGPGSDLSAGDVLNGEPSGSDPAVSAHSGTAGSTTPDPVAIVAREMCRDRDCGQVEWTGFPCSDCAEWARHLVAAIADRWRIVRTETVRPTWVERDYRIAEEWRP